MKESRQNYEFTHESGTGITHKISIQGEATLSELQELFKDFLRGVGFYFPLEEEE